VARAAADNHLLKFGAKGHLLCAGICALCFANDEDMRTRLEKYRDIDLQFEGSREAGLLDACAGALAAADERAFATAVAEFDSMTRLDAWKVRVFLRFVLVGGLGRRVVFTPLQKQVRNNYHSLTTPPNASTQNNRPRCCSRSSGACSRARAARTRAPTRTTRCFKVVVVGVGSSE
jgi:hypothetical protein